MSILIAKMYFVSITGPKRDIDRVVDEYLSRYEIHLEYAPAELKTVENLHPFTEQNIYREQMNYMEELAEHMGQPSYENVNMDMGEAAQVVNDIYEQYNEKKQIVEALSKDREKVREMWEKANHFVNVHYDMEELFRLRFLQFRFGRIPKQYYEKFEDYTYEDIASVFIKCSEDDRYVWGIYFVTDTEKDSVDAVYSSLHFERTFMPENLEGTPQDECEHLAKELESYDERIASMNKDIDKLFGEHKESFYKAYNRISRYAAQFEVRKYAACTKASGAPYYILCGWMVEEEAVKLHDEFKEHEHDNVCILDDKHETVDLSPPTKLKNVGIFKPFEMFIKMYGLPGYHEIDPTIFVALTYAFIFGAMFGDVGQGLFLCIGGFILYKVKKMSLAAIISCAGFFSTIFGFMFGSIFGFENIIDAVWLHPAKAMMDVPFIGKLNTVFIVAIGLGMILILVTMIMNIINVRKAGDKERLLFDTNGIAGLVFYGSLTAVLALFMAGRPLPASIVLVVMFVVPLLIIAFKEPLMHLVEKKAKVLPDGKGMFFVQTFFEMFEVLLSYFSNTLSFVRIGAFAVSHAAMMEVVLMLAGAENGNPGNMAVIIIGNIFVCGLEGLIVGIQVLRLEYYEMFSRFYKGNGREFKPYSANINTKK